MSIYDNPSPWTSETIFNRMCRAVERPFLEPPADRSRVAGPANHPLRAKLSAAMNELDENASRRNTSVRQLGGIMRSIMNETPLFHFDIPVLRRVAAYCSENPQDLIADPLPRLPFDSVCLANPYNAILLFDPDDGSMDRHQWPEGASWRCKILAYYQEETAWFHVMGSAHLLAPDHITLARQIGIADVHVGCAYTENGDSQWGGSLGAFKEYKPDQGANLHEIIRQSVSMALDACRYIDQPRHHLVMEEPRHWKPRKDAPKIPRAQDRPRVRIVEPEDVRRIYPHQTGDTTGRSVTPHARRGHIKTLRHPRYKEAQGRRLIIRPTWVGDPEWEHAGTKYKVIYRPKEEIR